MRIVGFSLPFDRRTDNYHRFFIAVFPRKEETHFFCKNVFERVIKGQNSAIFSGRNWGSKTLIMLAVVGGGKTDCLQDCFVSLSFEISKNEDSLFYFPHS